MGIEELRTNYQIGTRAFPLTARKQLTNAAVPYDLKHNFTTSYNGQISPEITSPTCGKVFPRLYA